MLFCVATTKIKGSSGGTSSSIGSKFLLFSLDGSKPLLFGNSLKWTVISPFDKVRVVLRVACLLYIYIYIYIYI